MNELVPQSKAKKKRVQELEPQLSERRRVLGFVLVLLSVFILLPELSSMSDEDNGSSSHTGSVFEDTLSEHEPWPEAPEMQKKSAPLQVTSVPVADLASLKSRWQAYHSDETSNTSVPVNSDKLASIDAAVSGQAVASVRPASAYIVQVATLSSELNANGLLNQLQKFGYRAFIREVGQYYQVIIGPDLRISDAESALLNVKKDLDLQGIIKSYRP